MAFFKRPEQNFSQRQIVENNYKTARYNLLLVIIFTLINIVMVATGSTSYFLFSAAIPYFIAFTGAMLTGNLPEEYYGEDLAHMEFFQDGLMYALIVVAVLVTALYFVAFLMLKKPRKGWFIAVTVLFAIDTVALFVLSDNILASLVDIIFHALVIYYLVKGIKACSELAKMPEEPAMNETTDTNNFFMQGQNNNANENIFGNTTSPQESEKNIFANNGAEATEKTETTDSEEGSNN